MKTLIRSFAFVCGGLLCSGLSSAAFGQNCSAPANPIEAENCLPGNPPSQWDVSGAGDPTIQGFGTDISVNAGQTITFKVKTDANAYTIEIYRIGYYGGMGARLITTLQPTAKLPQSQPACLSDASTGLVDCGNWAVSGSWQVPANATSGVYFAHLVRGDTGGDSHIVFVVRNDASHSAIMFQTSDESWQAYNGYGGQSFYGPDDVFDLNNRAYKVSYNRPFDTRGFEQESVTWVFGTEYPMIRFLEANSYDITYFTGLDAARNGSLIKNHKLYMDAGHDEYWSGPHRTNVEAARDAGVNMAFFSGNEVFWKTRWENSIDGTNTPYRTLVCYKETLGPSSSPAATAAVDPLDPPTWTGTWRDSSKSPPADGGRPENSLTGTIFTVNGPGADNPGDLSIQVPAADGKMRFWRNTSEAKLAAGQTATLPIGTLGYEWDEDLDNGARPAGTFDLSTTTATLTQDLLLDQGGVYGGGTATHHMTLYRAGSGALVFGAGTVQWSWGLDSTHDNPFFANTPPDPDMQQAVVNLFADMGVQPATLNPSLLPATPSTDNAPPSSTITTPSNGSLLGSNGNNITIQGTASDQGGAVAGVEVSVDGGNTWHPAAGRASWTYTWGPDSSGTTTIRSRAVDDSGNLEVPGLGVTVTVQGQTDMWSPTTTPEIVDSGDGGAVELGVKFTSSQGGFVTGIRFYKSIANTGTHIGNLWTSGGALLASAVFTGETTSGWQQVSFSTPIAITAGTTYVASYYAPKGHYSDTPEFFASSSSVNPPLTFLANNTSPNGIFTYGPGSTFPSSSDNATNYWVDVVFYPTTVTGPSVVTVSPSNGATGIIAGFSVANVTATFSESMAASTINSNTFTLSAAGTTVPATVSLNNSTQTATLVTTQPLAYSATYTATVVGGGNGVKDPDGKPIPSSYVWTFSTEASPAPCPCNIWSASTTPGTADSGDPSPVELGVKFSAQENGFITGIRFYKSAANTGTHVGNLWTTGGTLLASAVFTGETASGWQQVTFSGPVAVTAGTTYVASYYAPNGHYSVNPGFFSTAGVNNPPLQALANNLSANGLYAYDSASTFPGSSYNATNYWVDVVFATTVSVPVVTTVSPSISSVGVSVGTSINATFSESMNSSTVNTTTFQLSSLGSTVAATVVYNSSTMTATLVPAQPLAYSTTYTATILGGSTGVQDLNGKLLSANYGWTFTTTTPPPGTCPCSIWSPSATPGTIDSEDNSGVELGVKFTSSQNGFITGIRFYKSNSNTGTHIGNLWTTGGGLLATAVFAGETGSGWQQVNFSSPVVVTAGTTYVASYYAPRGRYSVDSAFFVGTGVSNPPLQALANSGSPNGVFSYGSASTFPGSSYNASNYWVDIVFFATVTVPSGPVITAVSPANGTTKVATATSVTAMFNESMNPSTINASTLQLSAAGTTVAATVSFNTLTATLVPTQPLAYSTAYTATVVGGSQGVQDINGRTLSSNVAWTFTTVPPPGTCPCSIWSPSTTPGTVDSGDPGGIELGVAFTSNDNGFITGVRFYKSATNTGTHIGNLWTNGGTLLASATFTNETASGWQQVNFSSPVAVTAGMTYVASYYAPNGHYSFDSAFFGTSGINNPPLQALANSVSPNGVYIYDSTTAFPSSSYNATNYWVDVVFNTTAQ